MITTTQQDFAGPFRDWLVLDELQRRACELIRENRLTLPQLVSFFRATEPLKDTAARSMDEAVAGRRGEVIR